MKQLFVLIFVLLTNSVSGQVVKSGLVAQYCFSGNANDELGVRHATVHGATLTTDRFGTPNEAYSFNGLYDYIQMPSDIWVAGDFSITGWLYVNTYGYWSRFFEWGNGIDKDNVFFSPCRGGAPDPVFTIHECGTSNRSYGGFSSGVFPTKQWVFVAITLSGDTARIYKDNVLWYSYKMAYIPCPVIRTECYFGRSNFSWDKSLDGKIDDVRIYNRVLTVKEIDTIYKIIGCGKADCHLSVVVSPHEKSICNGEELNLNASGAKKYKWLPSAGLNNDSISNPVFSGSSSGKYIVRGTDENGCFGYDSIDIKVNSLPIISAEPKNTRICEGQTVQLAATGGITYRWTPAEGLENATIANPKVIVKHTDLKYYVKGTDGNGCSGTDSVSISRLPNPLVTALPSDTAVCSGTEIQFKAFGALQYYWTSDNKLMNDSTTNTPKLFIAEGEAHYIVKGIDLNGCTGYDTVFIVGQSLPEVKASLNPVSEDCRKLVVDLLSTGADSYLWAPASFCDNNISSTTRVTVDKTVLFTVQGTDANGCSGIDTISVIYRGNSSVHVPNAFTPNGDNKNDVIRPIITCDFLLKEFSIYNRWGQQVYTSSNNDASWDGNFNGRPNEVGVYYYLLTGKDHEHHNILLKGDIILIR